MKKYLIILLVLLSSCIDYGRINDQLYERIKDENCVIIDKHFHIDTLIVKETIMGNKLESDTLIIKYENIDY